MHFFFSYGLSSKATSARCWRTYLQRRRAPGRLATTPGNIGIRDEHGAWKACVKQRNTPSEEVCGRKLQVRECGGLSCPDQSVYLPSTLWPELNHNSLQRRSERVVGQVFHYQSKVKLVWLHRVSPSSSSTFSPASSSSSDLLSSTLDEFALMCFHPLKRCIFIHVRNWQLPFQASSGSSLSCLAFPVLFWTRIANSLFL